MANEPVITLYSDGGSEQGNRAAAACILRSDSQEERLIVYLGSATNNEAEIIGGLAGFSCLISQQAPQCCAAKLKWVCDSEYVLKSATSYIHSWQKNGWKTAAKKPVKNQGLWRAFLSLSQGLTILPEHVFGHTGHVENEMCDAAVTWARAAAEDRLACREEGWLEPGIAGQESWYLIDGREFLSRLRVPELQSPSEEDCHLLVEKLRRVEKNKSGAASAAVCSPSGFSLNAEKRLLLQQKIKEAHDAACALVPDDPQALSIVRTLSKLLNLKTL